MRSLRHGFWYGLSERIRWSRGEYRETPALRLPPLDPEQAERIAALRDRYQVQFERRLAARTSLNNYEYLDILDRAWGAGGLARPQGGVLCDVGCASFWYAECLQTFFRPSELVGVEVEGFRLYRDGRTRLDYARGYLAQLPRARLRIADYRGCEEPADLICAWFPFVTPTAILAWRLPLTLLAPQALMRQVGRNLRRGGRFVMVNHGWEEAAKADVYCAAAGLSALFRHGEGGVLSRHRAVVPVVSVWQHVEVP